MLTLVLNQGIETTLTQIVSEYDVDPKTLQIDLIQLLQTLETQKLITSHLQSSSSTNNFTAQLLKPLSQILRSWLNPTNEPTSLTINLLLIFSWFSFRYLSWGKTLTLWQQWHPFNPQPDSKVDLQSVDRLIRETAASNLLLPMVCKERALVGYQLLKVFYQLPAKLIIGIQLYPLQLHAWVECNGQILTDDPEHCQQFKIIHTYS
jgi:predicted PurR-regulated permease PerM